MVMAMLVTATTMVTGTIMTMLTVMCDVGCDYNDNGNMIVMDVVMVLVVAVEASAVAMILTTVVVDQQEGWIALD